MIVLIIREDYVSVIKESKITIGNYTTFNQARLATKTEPNNTVAINESGPSFSEGHYSKLLKLGKGLNTEFYII